MIKPFKAPYYALILFQKNQDGTLWMCIDYKALPKVTIKTKYLIPFKKELFNKLAKTTFSSKLYLWLGY